MIKRVHEILIIFRGFLFSIFFPNVSTKTRFSLKVLRNSVFSHAKYMQNGDPSFHMSKHKIYEVPHFNDKGTTFHLNRYYLSLESV